MKGDNDNVLAAEKNGSDSENNLNLVSPKYEVSMVATEEDTTEEVGGWWLGG